MTRRLTPMMIAAAAAAAAALLPAARAELFVFDDKEAPLPYAMNTHYLFYIYAPKDAPNKRFGPAKIETDLMLVPDEKDPHPASAQSLAEYKSVEAVLFPASSLKAFVGDKKFCGWQGEPGAPVLNFLPSKASVWALLHTVTGERSRRVFDFGDGTGDFGSEVYVLAVANCGNLKGFKLVGSVVASNPHGYLSALDYHKLMLYGVLFFFYLVSALVWLRLLSTSRGSLFGIQKSLLCVNLLGVLESVVMWYYYHRMNTTKDVGSTLFMMGSLLSLWKVAILFRDMLTASGSMLMGAGQEEITTAQEVKVHTALVAYVGAELNLRLMARQRAGYALARGVVLLNALPAMMMGGLLLAWGYVSLTHLAESMNDQKREEEASVLRRSRKVVGFAVVGAIIIVLLPFLDPAVDTHARRPASAFRLHALFSDGVAQVVFAVALVAAMCVWRPSSAPRQVEYGMVAGTDVECQNIIGAPGDESGDEPASEAPRRQGGSEE